VDALVVRTLGQCEMSSGATLNSQSPLPPIGSAGTSSPSSSTSAQHSLGFPGSFSAEMILDRPQASAGETPSSEKLESEMLVLRSRVEQQSDLIMMLKTRNDELSTEIDGMKSTVSRVGLEKTKIMLAKDKVVKELNTLQDRFDTLAKQHQQMIELKDEHKTAKKRLQGQVNVLTAQVETITETLEAEHKSEKETLRAQLGGAQAELAKVQQELKTSTVTAAAKLDTAVQDGAAIRSKYDALAKQHDALKLQLAKEKNQSTATIKRLTADEKGASEAAKRASAKAETLGDELHSSEAAARAARDEANELKRRLKKESASSQVADANSELQAAIHSMKSTKQEYEAYKKYSTDLLKKEKEMNQRLRHLHASGP